jgi:hypothetical protein
MADNTDELNDIKSILAQIRDQNAASAGKGGVNAADLESYTRELKIARTELDMLEKGTGAYNRKQKEVESLTRKARNALRDQREETDLLTLSTQGLTGAFSLLANTADKVILKFSGLIKGIFDEAKSLDTLTIQFQATTGASTALAANIGQLTDRLRLYGVSSKEALEAVSGLQSGFTGFTQLNQIQQAEIGRTTALMAELGVSVQASAQIMESSTRTLGYSLGESEQLLLDMRGTAMALEVPIENLTRDFASAENMIAALGRTGPDSFKELAAQSKATGVEMSTMLGLVEKFDTFEGAASAVQGLNAVLGGNFLDSLSMVQEVDPARRFEMIRDAVFEAGHSVESLADSNNYYLKKSLAATLGLGVSDFMKMLSGDVEELTGQVENASYSFEQMSKDAFGLKGFDSVIDGIMGSFQRPVQQIQEATRAMFQGMTPLIDIFEKYNAQLITKTESFVKNNTELVGAVGLLYNLAGIDGVQKGYEIFKGIAGFTGTVLSNLFSVKGVLALMAGGVLYLIRKDLTDIWDTFQTDGPIAAIGQLFSTIFTRLNDLRKEWHIDAAFFTDVFGVVKAYAVQAFHFVKKEFLGPLYDYIEREGIFYFEQFFNGVVNNIKRTIAQELLFGGQTGMTGWAMKKLGNKLAGDGFFDKKKGRTRAEIEADQDVGFRKTMRSQDYANAQLAAQTARAQFDSNAAVVKITKEASGVIKALAPVTKQAGDMFSSITNYLETTASDAWAESLAPALQKGAAQMQLAVDVHIDGEKLDSRIGRATRTNLAGAGRSAVLDGGN